MSNQDESPNVQPAPAAQPDQPNQLIKAVQYGDQYFVTHVGSQRLEGSLDDGSLPTLSDVRAMFAQQGFQPISDVDYTLARVTPREAVAGVSFVFKRMPATIASQALALAKPAPAAPVVVPPGMVADARFAKGYRPADVDPETVYDPRLKKGVKPGASSLPKPAPAAPKAAPKEPAPVDPEAAQRMRNLKNKF